MSAPTILTSSTAAADQTATTATAPLTADMTPDELELFYLRTLSRCNRLSKDEGPLTEEVAMAKLANACVRMLHSQNWQPRTVIRTLVNMQLEPDQKVTGLLRRSMHERRDEGRARQARRQAEADRVRDTGNNTVAGGPLGGEAVEGAEDINIGVHVGDGGEGSGTREATDLVTVKTEETVGGVDVKKEDDKE